MNLYKTWVHTPDEGCVQVWTGTQADAKLKAKELKAEYPDEGVYTEPVDVPTDKPGLLAWLNAYFNRDNG